MGTLKACAAVVILLIVCLHLPGYLHADETRIGKIFYVHHEDGSIYKGKWLRDKDDAILLKEKTGNLRAVMKNEITDAYLARDHFVDGMAIGGGALFLTSYAFYLFGDDKNKGLLEHFDDAVPLGLLGAVVGAAVGGMIETQQQVGARVFSSTALGPDGRLASLHMVQIVFRF